MAMSDKCAIIGGKRMNVYTEEQLFKYKADLLQDDQSAIEIKNGDETIILPVRSSDSSKSDKPGVYVNEKNPFAFLCYPTTDEEKAMYIPPKDHIVDWKEPQNMQELADLKDHLNKTMNQYLETDTESGNIFKPPLLEDDTAEMRALKQCIIQKNVEIDKYAERFGVNFPNDKRKMKDKEITSYLLKRTCSNLDIEVDMVFRDVSPDVPNPMGKVIRVNLVPGLSNNVIIEESKG